MDGNTLVESSFSVVINAPIEKVDIPSWCPLHNPMIPHTIALEPGLVVYTISMAYWFFGRPTVEDPESVFAAEL